MEDRMINSLRAVVPLLLLVLLASVVESRIAVGECRLDFMRLPRRVQPSNYRLDVKVDPEERHFTGRVEIDLVHDQNPNDALCRKRAEQSRPACDRSMIILSADKSLEIDEVEYREQNTGLTIPVKSLCRDSENSFLMVKLSRAPGMQSLGKLKFSYTGEVLTDFRGLFRADYNKPGEAKTGHILMTKFESVMARMVLPCFDEPEFKATFELAIEHPSHLMALSNTPVEHEEQIRYEAQPWLKEFTKSHFGRTPKMSSYLLAFAVGEFERVESTILDGAMTLRVYTPPGRADSADAKFSLDTAVRGYLALEDFFGVSQPVKKIDFVSCKEFPGAMENWGLISMDEASLLPNLKSYVATNMHYTIKTIIHELSHQWFGNLVTMRWWDDLWLNEGFASWISNELTHELFPELEANYMYLLRSQQVAFIADSDEQQTHPIKNLELRTVKDIEDSFDEICYEKSDAVLNMLSSYIGPKQFKAGLGAYIRANQYRNTEDTDLWSALAETSGLDVKQLMRSWLHQEGFPLISVSLSKPGTLVVSQMRFLSVGKTGEEEKINKRRRRKKNSGKREKWIVPISLWVSNGKDKLQKIKFVLSQERDKIKLPSWFDINQSGHWLKLNSDFEGFYRVRYETAQLFEALRMPITTQILSPIDRLNLLDEALGLVQANQMDASQLGHMLTWFEDEKHDAVVAMISQILSYLNIQHDEDYMDFYEILINHYEGNNRLAEETSPSLLKRHARSVVLQRLIDGNYWPAIKDCVELFDKSPADVPGFIRNQVFGAVARAGPIEHLEQVIRLIKQMNPENLRYQPIRYVSDGVKNNLTRKRLVERHFGSDS